MNYSKRLPAQVHNWAEQATSPHPVPVPAAAAPGSCCGQRLKCTGYGYADVYGYGYGYGQLRGSDCRTSVDFAACQLSAFCWQSPDIGLTVA